MKTSSSIARLSSASAAIRGVRVAGLTALLCITCSNGFAQNRADDQGGGRRRGGGTDTNGNGGGNFNPQEMQARMLTALRERFEVTDDEEWKLISERITKVSDLRRNAATGGFGGGGFFAGRGGPGGTGGTGGQGGGGGGTDRGGRGTRTGGGSAEMTALSSAVRDKLPDAEIKSRLDRVREVRKDNEAKLAK